MTLRNKSQSRKGNIHLLYSTEEILENIKVSRPEIDSYYYPIKKGLSANEQGAEDNRRNKTKKKQIKRHKFKEVSTMNPLGK